MTEHQATGLAMELAAIVLALTRPSGVGDGYGLMLGVIAVIGVLVTRGIA